MPWMKDEDRRLSTTDTIVMSCERSLYCDDDDTQEEFYALGRGKRLLVKFLFRFIHVVVVAMLPS